ncbi:MAG TPA: Tad domain-containing protein, partial [Gemmatimonadales bacterium]|nr:Tad domain-containing protein [Gemmatimonadales bacterium]
MRARLFGWRNERGATIALVAVSLTALLGMGALAVDLSMLMKARSDAQRTADAAALAGASAFIDENVALDQLPAARERALEFADSNYVGATRVDVDTTGLGTTVDGTRWIVESKEAVIIIIPDSFKVRAIIRRQNIGTFFGRIMGQSLATVSAKAAAEAVNSNGTKCVKPFALPDMWQDVDDDVDGDRLWDEGEEWEYDPAVDEYKPYQGDPVQYGNIDDTGYGSHWRDESPDDLGDTFIGDKGRQIHIKPQDPNETGIIYPGIFYPWVMPEDPTQEANCGIGGSGGEEGAAPYSQNICSCNNSLVLLGVDYEIKTGNMVGPSYFGIQDLIDLDPKAEWDPAGDSVRYSKAENWLDSPR